MENFFTILGGMGTQATESFVHLLNERTPNVHSDQDYLNYLLLNHASVPDRTSFILGGSDQNPELEISADIQQIAPLQPDFFVIACNTAHYFYENFQALTSIPILHMPRLAVQEVCKQFANVENTVRVGILATEGTLETQIYENEIKQYSNLQPVLPKTPLQSKVNQLIYHDVKENNFSNSLLYEEILQEMFTKYDCDLVILGCTELSFVQAHTPNKSYPLIDAQSVLVDATIKRALNK